MLAQLYRYQVVPAAFDDDGNEKKPAKGRVTFDFDPNSREGKQFIRHLTEILSAEYVELDCEPVQRQLPRANEVAEVGEPVHSQLSWTSSASVSADDAKAQLDWLDGNAGLQLEQHKHDLMQDAEASD